MPAEEARLGCHVLVPISSAVLLFAEQSVTDNRTYPLLHPSVTDHYYYIHLRSLVPQPTSGLGDEAA